jgi:hypothetical protein
LDPCWNSRRLALVPAADAASAKPYQPGQQNRSLLSPASRAARSPGHSDSNPKIDPAPNSKTEKEPDDWVSGDDPMTGAQASYLKTLSERCGEPETFSQT